MERVQSSRSLALLRFLRGAAPEPARSRRILARRTALRPAVRSRLRRVRPMEPAEALRRAWLRLGLR